MFDTAVFIHVAAINNYQQMYDQLFDQIAKSGLLMVVDEVNVCVVAGQELNVIQSPVVKVHYDPDGACLLYTSPSPRDVEESRMPSSA